MQGLPARARRTCSEQEERLLRNVVSSLAQALQDLSTGFRHAQAGYLKRECRARRPRRVALPVCGCWFSTWTCASHRVAPCDTSPVEAVVSRGSHLRELTRCQA